jgi:RHS repeat-associated protein
MRSGTTNGGGSAGHGEYWFGELDPESGQVVRLSPRAINNSQNSTNGSGGLPGASSWKTEYIHSDHLGSTRLVTDEMGQFVAGYRYYPFGHEAEISGVSDVRMKFTGHERDRELGSDYMLARHYGASLGRFLGVDPVLGHAVSPQSWNRYCYVSNNPLKYTDPTGAYKQGSGWTDKKWKKFNRDQRKAAKKLRRAARKLQKVIKRMASGKPLKSKHHAIARSFVSAFGGSATADRMSDVVTSLEQSATALTDDGPTGYYADGLDEPQWNQAGLNPNAFLVTDTTDGRVAVRMNHSGFGVNPRFLWGLGHEGLHSSAKLTDHADAFVTNPIGQLVQQLAAANPNLAQKNPDNIMRLVDLTVGF